MALVAGGVAFEEERLMQEPLLIALGVVLFLVVVVILPMVIENNIFAGIMTLLLGPFLGRRKDGSNTSKDGDGQ